MARRTLLVPGLAAALTLALSPVTAVSADEGPAPAPRAAEAPARQALVQAERALAGRAAVPEIAGGRSLTMLLRDLRASYDELAPAEQRRADRLFARPVGGDPAQEIVVYDAGANPATVCSDVCVTWARATEDAPPMTDGDTDGVPDYVETVRDELDGVWQRIVVQGGYRAPLSDATSYDSGPNEKLDVYLADLGDMGYYGYCTSDDPAWETSNTISAFCVLDDDYDPGQYGTWNTPLDNMRVTAGHEFFHAVQFAYDYLEDAWLMEASSAWIEDELYDEINDNRQYLQNSPLSHPGMPLDYSDESYLGQYGAWIFLRYLTERFPDEGGTGLPLAVRRIWDRAAAPTLENWGEYSLQAIANEVASHGTSFTRFFQQFGVANRRPASFYEEGSAYPAAPIADTVKVKTTKPYAVKGKPYHLSNGTVRVVPGKKLKAKTWKARVKADLPQRSYGYGLAVTVLYRSGKVATKYVSLAADGDGTVKVPFSRKKVKALELTFTNASTRFSCWENTSLTCMGTSLDDDRTAKATIKALR